MGLLRVTCNDLYGSR